MRDKKTYLLELFNREKGTTYNTFEELMDYLNDQFRENYESIYDAQQAFNLLSFELGFDFLPIYFCYVLSDGGSWELSSIDGATCLTKEQADEMGYTGDINDMEEFCSYLEKQVCDAMNNIGCDAKNAFGCFIEDYPFLEDKVEVIVPDGEPTLELIEDFI